MTTDIPECDLIFNDQQCYPGDNPIFYSSIYNYMEDGKLNENDKPDEYPWFNGWTGGLNKDKIYCTSPSFRCLICKKSQTISMMNLCPYGSKCKECTDYHIKELEKIWNFDDNKKLHYKLPF